MFRRRVGILNLLCHRTLCLTTVLCAVFSGHVHALRADKSLTQFSTTSWQTESGLPELAIESLIEASDGYLWVGTQEGLARFDGHHFTVFDHTNTPALASDWIGVLLEDAHKNIWIGTQNTLVVRSVDGTFRTMGDDDKFHINVVKSGAIAGDGSIWIAGDGGVVHINDGKVVRSFDGFDGLKSEAVSNVIVDSDAVVWLVAQGRLYRIHNDVVEAVQDAADLDGQSIVRLFTNKQGQLWVLCTGGKMLRFANGRFESWWPQGVPTSENIQAIHEDRNGTTWFATETNGIFRTRDTPDGQRVAEHGFPGTRIDVLYEDTAGNMWFGAFGRGLYRLRDGSFATMTMSEGLVSDTVLAVVVDASNATWIGTLGGLDRVANNATELFSKTNGLANNLTASLALGSDAGLWVGSRGNVVDHLAAGKVDRHVVLPSSAENATVTALLEDSQKILWAGTKDAGVIRNAETGPQIFTTANGLPNNRVSAIVEDWHGDIWLGTEGGLARFSNGALETYPLRKFQLPQLAVLSMHEDAQKSLWVGTADTGLLKVERELVTRYDSRQGLPSDPVNSIITDERGNLWLGLNHGIIEIDRAQIDEVAAGRRERFDIKHFGEADGMRTAETVAGRQPPAARGPDGRLWFVTGQGIVVVDPLRIERDTRPLRPIIESVSANGVPIAMNGETFTLPARTSKLEIRYTAPNLTSAAGTQFRYRLSGFDDNWSYVSDERVARYIDITPGSHEFFLQARRQDEVWRDDVQKSVLISATPAFYQTYWFLTLMALLVLLSLWILHYARLRWVRMQSAVAEERRRIAGEIHDSLAQGFSAILVQIEAALSRLQRSPELVAGHLELVRDVSRLGLYEARESIWNLQGRPEDTTPLVAIIESVCNPLISSHQAKLFVTSQGKPWKANPVIEHNVVRIAQEAVSNAVNHGEANEVHIEIEYKFTQLMLRITDDGIGYDEETRRVEERRGYGIKSMRHRAHVVRGVFRINSAPGVGTRVEATIPRSKLIFVGRKRFPGEAANS